MKGEHKLPVALQGFCPVCLMDMRQWVNGNPSFAANYDGKTYLFPEQKQLDAFRKNPVQYVPQLGGDCLVHFAQTGQRVPGDLRLGAVHNHRLVFFSNEQHRKAFHANPSAYANADLVLGGECVVCRVDGNMQTQGQKHLTLLHHGRRYQFAEGKHQSTFAAAPDRYAGVAESSPARAPSQAPSDSGSGSGSNAPIGGSGRR